ncbi:MAG TPA: PAS domain S-box protein, partial [Gemmatimonadaceae bacterium]|nr:PAS domain S-box protein [Gemmatimonadaceae bacterium]
MMPSSASPARRILPTPWVLLLRDRLAYFRTLTLMLALLTLWGLSITYSLGAGATNGHLLALGIAAAGLTAAWIRGLRRRNFPRASLGLELALVLAFMWGGRDDFGAFGLLYVALQFRALFGTRREVFIVACAVGATYIGGHSVLPGGMASLDPVVAVEIAVGGFCVYLMHTLSEVLVRDQERKRALHESEQRFRSVIENLREALLISDPDDTVLLANARVLDVLGYEPSELIGRNVAEVLVPPAARDAFRAHKADRMQGRSDLYETILKRKDGTLIHAEISASPYRDSAGTIVGSLGAISDISERKRLEGRLRQGMRLEAVGQLAGGVAHDFNNLLTVIKCHTELLLGDLPHGDPNRDSVVEIDKSTDRGASLTQQLLAFSRKQLLQPQRISVAQVVANNMAMLRGMVAP